MTTADRPAALVTGASSGIGKATALALAAAGSGTSRDTPRAAPPGGVTSLGLDVASDASATAAVEQVPGRSGRIDLLVSNVGLHARAITAVPGAVAHNGEAGAERPLPS